MSAVPKNLRAFVDMVESVKGAIQILDRVESVEQFEREHQMRLDAMRQEQAAAEQARDQAKRAIDEAKAKAAETLANADIAAANLIARAKAEAEIVADKAAKAVADAKAKESLARLSETEAKNAFNVASKHLVDVQEELEKAKAVIAKAEAIKLAMG